MEIKKTTLLSALVCVAGVLAEIMFHDVLTGTIPGVALSVALAVISLTAAYFVLDGLYAFLTIDREIGKRHQEEFEQRISGILNELLQFEKAIYKEIRALQQVNVEAGQTEMQGTPPAFPLEQQAASVSEERIEKLENAINENTTMTAKIIAKYVNRNTGDLKELLENHHAEITKLLKEMDES